MKDNFYIDFVQNVPVDQVNAWIARHGYQPLDPKQISLKQVAIALEAIVHAHGSGAYKELVGIREQAGQRKVNDALKEMVDANTPKPSEKAEVIVEKATYNCDGEGACGSKCPCQSRNKTLSADGGNTSSAPSFSISDFINNNSKLVIIGTTAIIITLIVKLKK